MSLLSVWGLGTTSPVCDADDIYALLVSVLPTFIAIAERTLNNLPDLLGSDEDPFTETRKFYIHFKTVVFNLNAVLVLWDPAGPAFRRIGFQRNNDETYPKLRALRRTLPEDDPPSERFLTDVGYICPSSAFHVSRKTRLNLTQYQRFEVVPSRGQVLSNSEARFRILFPTSSWDLEWQDTEIAVNSRIYEKTEHTEVKNGLCGIILGVKAGIRPRMVVHARKLWQLHADVETNRLCPPQVRDVEFMSLKDLLKPNRSNHESLMSSMEGKDRLILSFVLATSLLHFFKGPWLQASLSSENICFLVSHRRSLPNITKPYLTTSCSSLTREGLPREFNLNQPHRFPDILSLGILLLEIARGAPIDFQESQDRCVVALECMEKWTKTCRAGRSRTIHDCLRQTISACIDPREFMNVLHMRSVNDFEIRRYIFERILYPLDYALSTVYEIQSNNLHEDISRANEAGGIGSFDHQDEDELEKQEAADEWLGHLDGVHDLFYKCQDLCEEAVKRATRVKVAVLDTGFQLPEVLQENYEGEDRINFQQSDTFVPATKGDATHDWKVDCDGHGSRVGQIVLRVAPAADLHVAKVFRTKDDLADPEMAVQAINRATHDWKVDIIIMCFGFDQIIPLIRKAMDDALMAKKPPLFFAATSNDGAHKRTSWPARDISVIGISSTAGNGDVSPFNPSEKDAHPILYAFGEGVPIEVAAPRNPERLITKYVSGTSYATPVAAGLAANLLGCVRMVVESTFQGEDRALYSHVPRDLEQMRGMLAVLRRHMRRKHVCGVKSLLPWDFLKVQMLDNNKILRDVADTLLEG
ncbi:subtilase [Colletotrichum graminicola M1.001]|uniref:Subtilase n=1 Tax=Colletotrichum graminicola (strain M1.001 / M2 / FGSC 10212) TaxID=645133 RepID=E3QYT1_COLGM|nr:subtilase [Colletotrichum graminicola M1.001]EFQ36019.1 subtilase [Colletotrichum graminicola M1.001]